MLLLLLTRVECTKLGKAWKKQTISAFAIWAIFGKSYQFVAENYKFWMSCTTQTKMAPKLSSFGMFFHVCQSQATTPIIALVHIDV